MTIRINGFHRNKKKSLGWGANATTVAENTLSVNNVLCMVTFISSSEGTMFTLVATLAEIVRQTIPHGFPKEKKN